MLIECLLLGVEVSPWAPRTRAGKVKVTGTWI